ncbi:MAG TPA: L-lactate permease, partial [Hyphomicrobium sp.]|nr:L-lactate permease [Hyphomicrobium sp.]
VLVPFWLITAFAGWRRTVEVWPPILVAGVAFAIPQYLVSNFHGPWLVDIVAAVVSMAALAMFLKVWRPARPMTAMPGAPEAGGRGADAPGAATHTPSAIRRAWMPWVVLSVFVFLWGTPQVRAMLDDIWVAKLAIPGLHELVQKVPPVVATPKIEAAVFNFNALSATGTGILLAAIVSGFALGYGPGGLLRTYARTLYLVRYSLLTIACMLAIGFVTRYSGIDATLGLALANTGWLYPLFGTYIGWLGVTLTGSDTASNVLFGGLQRVSAEQLGLNPVLMAAANSSGGVMGKMMDAQSIVVASTATRWYGHEGSILRFVAFHSIALATLVGLLVLGQAYVWPLTLLAPG